MSPPVGPAPAEVVRARLRDLVSAGAGTFAPSAYAFVETLLARGEALGGGAGARLIGRAALRAEALGRELDEAKTRARESLGSDHSQDGALAPAIDAGRVHEALRAARRRRIAPGRPDAGLDAWLGRLSSEARARGLPCSGRAVGPLAAVLYESSRDALSATLVAVRAEADVPANAGPYNPLAIAARTLAELSKLAPAYLAATVAYLDELAPLLSLPAPAPERARPSPAGPRRKRPARPPR